jgi:PAS domain S-box-containing protein
LSGRPAGVPGPADVDALGKRVEEDGLSPAHQLRSLGQAVVATDVDGVVMAWNPAAERLCGWSAEEAIGRNITDLCMPSMAKEVSAAASKALRAGTPWSGGVLLRRRNGTTFPGLVTQAGMYRDGDLVGMVGVFANLGTALRPLLERFSEATLMMRADGVITYASPAVEQIFGWPDEDLLGNSVVPLLHPDDWRALGKFLAEVANKPGAQTPLEIRVHCDGTWKWAEATLTNLLDDPVVHGVVCNLRLSLRRDAQEEAEARVKQLQSALEARLVIELAKGYLAGRHDLEPEAAFDLMRQHARSHHLALREVARRIVAKQLCLSPR